MKPTFLNLNKALGRMEEIERKVRAFSEDDMARVREQNKARFVDVLKEEEKKIAPPPLPGKSQTPAPQKAAPPAKIGANKSEYDKYIVKYAKQYGVDENLVRAVVRAESGFNPSVRSPKGAMGLMQLMPGTAKYLGVDDPWDPEQNIRGGVKYLAELSAKFNGNTEKILAGYNAGPHRVVQYGGVPPYAETQNYVKKIMGWLGKK